MGPPVAVGEFLEQGEGFLAGGEGLLVAPSRLSSGSAVRHRHHLMVGQLVELPF